MAKQNTFFWGPKVGFSKKLGFKQPKLGISKEDEDGLKLESLKHGRFKQNLFIAATELRDGRGALVFRDLIMGGWDFLHLSPVFRSFAARKSSMMSVEEFCRC